MAGASKLAKELLTGFIKESGTQAEDKIIDFIFDAIFADTPFSGIFGDDTDNEEIDNLTNMVEQLVHDVDMYYQSEMLRDVTGFADDINSRWSSVITDWKNFDPQKRGTFQDYLNHLEKNEKRDIFGQDPIYVSSRIQACATSLVDGLDDTCLSSIRGNIVDGMTIHDALDVTNPFLSKVLSPIATARTILKVTESLGVDTDAYVRSIETSVSSFRGRFRNNFGNLDEIGALVAGLPSGGGNVRKMTVILSNAATRQVIDWDDSVNSYRGGNYSDGACNECYDFRDGNDNIPQGWANWSGINYQAQRGIQTLRQSNDRGVADGWGDSDNRQGNVGGILTMFNRNGGLFNLTPVTGGDAKNYFPFQIHAVVEATEWDGEYDPDAQVLATFMMDAWDGGNYLRSSRCDRGSVSCQYWVVDVLPSSMETEQPSLGTSFEWLTKRSNPPTEKLNFGLDSLEKQ